MSAKLPILFSPNQRYSTERMKMKGLIKDSLERPDCLEEQRSCSASLKDQINTLKIELKFLRTFFMSKKLMQIQIQSGELKDRYKKIIAVIPQDVGQVILSLGGGEVPLDLDRSLFSVQEKIELIKLEVHQCYLCFKESWPKGDIDGDLQVKCIDYVLENMKDLIQSKVNSVVGEKKRINTLERRLRFLRNSLQLVAKLELGNRDLYHLKREVGYAATIAASFFFSCWINKMDENSDLSLALHYQPNGEKTSLYCAILYASDFLTSDATVSLLVGFIDFLLEQLAELRSRDGNAEIPTKDHFESLCEQLKLVISLLTTTPRQHADQLKSYRKHIGPQLNKVARFLEDFYVGNTSEEMMTMNNALLLPLLGRLKLINLFWKLDRVNDETSLPPPMKDQFETFGEDMQLLRTFFIDTQKGDTVHQDIHNLMDALALEAGSAIYSFHVNEIKEGLAEEMSSLLPDLLEKIKLIKAEMRKIYPHATSSNFRDTSDQKGMTILLKELNALLKHKVNVISRFAKPHMKIAAKVQMENVHEELKILISFLENSEEQDTEIGELKALENRVMNITKEANHAIDPNFFRDVPAWYCMLKLSDVMEEVKLFKNEIQRINEKISSGMLSLQDNTLAIGEVIVGFEDEAEKIKERLIGGPKELYVISIIGMAGLGKTTLAKKMYSNPSVVEYFDVRAWCCASQEYQSKQMLIDILGQVFERTEKIDDKSVAALAELLCKSLKGRRFLIAIDDIWDIEAWNALRRCFNGNCQGSRIILTTRLGEIASKVRERSILHQLRLFNDDESWELLRQKLFLGKRYLTKQVEIVKQIAKDCKGIPLVVVLMAGILARKKKEEWEQVAKSLSRHTNRDLKILSWEVVELSYKNLPDRLRPCFLYLGAFPEDKEIPAKKLLWFWVAEGFMPKAEHKNLEDIAKDYLLDLISRSLVIVAERGSRSGVKSCRIHDLLRDFSLAKAKQEKFLLLLGGNDEPVAPIDLKFHHQVDGYVESYNSNPTTYDKYRLCIYSMLNDFDKCPSSLQVCSLLHFAPTCQLDRRSSHDASFKFSSFKFLNVLDLGRLVLKDLNCEIQLLLDLRLLAVQIRSNSIPSSIANLRNLETFLVKGKRGQVDIPDTILSMVSLRHLHIDNLASVIWEKSDVKDAISDKLETLSTPILSYGTKSREMIHSLPNIRRLKCIFTTESGSNSESCNIFPELDSLIQLESLKVFYHGRKVSHGKFTFPLNLKKLTLSKFHLPWSDIATIATLPKLEVLKLLFKAFDGKEWETKDDEFPKLKYLKLECLDIEQWNISSEEHFPVLEKLVVHRCKQLEEIPSIVGDINTLQMIEVKWCNPFAANSARKIYQEQQEYGKGLEVIIHPHQGLTSSS